MVLKNLIVVDGDVVAVERLTLCAHAETQTSVALAAALACQVQGAELVWSEQAHSAFSFSSMSALVDTGSVELRTALARNITGLLGYLTQTLGIARILVVTFSDGIPPAPELFAIDQLNLPRTTRITLATVGIHDGMRMSTCEQTEMPWGSWVLLQAGESAPISPHLQILTDAAIELQPQITVVLVADRGFSERSLEMTTAQMSRIIGVLRTALATSGTSGAVLRCVCHLLLTDARTITILQQIGTAFSSLVSTAVVRA
jgi:hypothetical protein